jgi:hypothetical protein
MDKLKEILMKNQNSHNKKKNSLAGSGALVGETAIVGTNHSSASTSRHEKFSRSKKATPLPTRAIRRHLDSPR